ncbi:RND superfamily drug exporter-like protein [Planomonospora sphaerica]|uniref:RND superfamily drug exporter-like protein n=1 Tax=Planomonospora sphaerica TaxID=161355 RepID=A0A171DME8_9ACTN|nr:MMPL family transporter [Planomonospora sphaerica]GAT70138.1 RND superfamily drug exporter-like protein [Planomonospora sphaerica]
MFESLGRFVHRRRWAILASGAVFAVLAGLFGLGLFGRMTDGGFEDPGAESTSAARWSQEWFGGSSPDVVVLYTNPEIEARDERFRKDVEKALEALPAEHVAEVSTYWKTEAEELVSADGHSTYALIALKGEEQDGQRRYEVIEERLRQAPAGYDVRIGGRVPLLADLNAQTAADLRQAEAISMPVLLVLLVVVFGSLVAAGLPLVVGVLSVIGALALLRLLTEVTDVSVFSLNVVTMLGLGLAIDYSLFVLSAFREEIRRGSPVQAAVVRTIATAGRTVAFSGLTVATALCGLLLFPQMFLRSIGLGAAAVVLVAMAAALVVLPALLAVLGPRVDALNVMPDFGRRRRGSWHRIASSVMRRPVAYLVGVGAVLLALAAPFLHVRFGGVDHRVLPEHFESRQVAERIDRDFARNAMAPIEAVVLVERDLVGPMTAAAPGALPSEVGGRLGPVGVENSGPVPVTEVGPLDVKVFADRLKELDHVTGVDVTGVSQAGGAVRLAVRHDGDPASDEARALVERIRALPPEPNFQDVVVGGPTAAQLDLEDSLTATLPWTALVVCLMTGLLLFAAFGSVLLPLKAILMNVLSLGASFGVIVWAFQDGNLAGVLGFTPTGSVEATITVLILAVVFGLSMDYELFLLSRVRAEWLRTGDNTAAVAIGLERTGGLISSAALLLLVVIAAFSTAGITIVKMLGVGMFVAIVVDATLVRGLLVPATMRLMGEANWWLPAPLRDLHRRIGLREHHDGPYGPPPAHVTVERTGGPAAAPAGELHGARGVHGVRDAPRALPARPAEASPRWIPQITPPQALRTGRTPEALPSDVSEVTRAPEVREVSEVTRASEAREVPAPPAEVSVSPPQVPKVTRASEVQEVSVPPPEAPRTTAPAFTRELRAPAPQSRRHGSNPYPLPPLPVNGAAKPPAPARTEQAVPVDPAQKRRRVVKPNLDGPGWHWAEEGTAPSSPQPLLTVEGAMGRPPRTPLHSPVPDDRRPDLSPFLSPPSVPSPPSAPSSSPPPSPPPPSPPPVPAAPGSGPGPVLPARSLPAISPHLIDRLEPPARRQDSRPIVPITARPEPAEEVEATEPLPGLPVLERPAPERPAPGLPAPGASASREGRNGAPAPEHAAPRESWNGGPERDGGWVPVGRRATRVVRPTSDGSGWTWVEVNE